jgi:uncharacterized protein YndB with AHSA1/START domain
MIGGAIAEVRRRFAAPPARVFAAFAQAELVRQWLSPAPDIALTVLQLDFRVGGAWRFAYHLPNQDTVVIGGVYRRIEPPRLIVFSWVIEPPDVHAGIESEVTVTITPDGSGTALHIRHARLTLPGAALRHAEGWRGALDRLTALIAGAST